MTKSELKKVVAELDKWVNWNYIGMVAAILSLVVTAYNVNLYWKEIKAIKK